MSEVSIPKNAAKLGEGLSIRLLRISPDVAKQWLAKNHENNRAITRSRVRTYAADMAAGRWLLSDQAVSFDVEGRLVNGQKRLSACILADAPFLSLVLYGLPTTSMLALDGGQKRSTDDNAKMDGRDWPKGCGATVRRIFLGAQKFSGRAFTDLEVAEFMDAHGAAVAFAHRHLPKGRTATASTRSVVARAAVCKKDPQRLADFCRVLTTGLMAHGDEAAVLLRNVILDADNSGGTSRAALYLACGSALTQFLAGNAVKKIPPNAAELFPIPGEGEWFGEA